MLLFHCFSIYGYTTNNKLIITLAFIFCILHENMRRDIINNQYTFIDFMMICESLACSQSPQKDES